MRNIIKDGDNIESSQSLISNYNLASPELTIMPLSKPLFHVM